MTRSERRRAEKRRREQRLHALLENVAGLAYTVPVVSGGIMWWVSGSVPLALAILGAGLAAISVQLVRFYEVQIRENSLADDLRLGDGQNLSGRRRKAPVCRKAPVSGGGILRGSGANDPTRGGCRGGARGSRR